MRQSSNVARRTSPARPSGMHAARARGRGCWARTHAATCASTLPSSRGSERDAAALAAVVGQLEVAAEARAAVVRDGEVDRGAAIRSAFAFAGGDAVALVDPGDEHLPAAVHRDRVEAMRDLLPVGVHGDRRAERPAAVERAREADVAGVGLAQRPGPGDVELAAGTDGDLRAGVAVRADRLRRRVDGDRLRPRAAEVVGAARPRRARPPGRPPTVRRSRRTRPRRRVRSPRASPPFVAAAPPRWPCASCARRRTGGSSARHSDRRPRRRRRAS